MHAFVDRAVEVPEELVARGRRFEALEREHTSRRPLLGTGRDERLHGWERKEIARVHRTARQSELLPHFSSDFLGLATHGKAHLVGGDTLLLVAHVTRIAVEDVITATCRVSWNLQRNMRC